MLLILVADAEKAPEIEIGPALPASSERHIDVRLNHDRLFRIDMKRKAARLHDPRNFGHDARKIQYVLDDRSRDDDVEAVILEGDVELAFFDHRVRGVCGRILHEAE